MKNTYIVPLIQSMSIAERRNVHLWLQSPAHNTRTAVYDLFNVLEEYLHLLEMMPNRATVFKKVFKNENFDDQKLRLHCNYLLKALEAFLVFRANEKSLTNDLSLLRIYKEKGIQKHYQHQQKILEQKFQRYTTQEPERHWLYYQFLTEKYRWDSVRKPAKELSLMEQEQQLHVAFICFKLRQACLTLTHQHLVAEAYSIPGMEAVLSLAQQENVRNIPAVQVYSTTYLMCQHPEQEATFRDYYEAFSKHASLFPIDEARDLLLLGINFGILRINRGEVLFLKETLHLYRQGLDNNLLLEKGRLKAQTYSNIIGIAIRVGDLTWAETFLKTYRPKLKQSDRNQEYGLNAARISFAKKDFPAALDHLEQIPQRTFLYQMAARVIQLKVYHETDEDDLLVTHIRNSRAFLERRKRMGYHEKNYRNILDLTEKLIKCNFYDSASVKALETIITTTFPLTERAWLLKALKN